MDRAGSVPSKNIPLAVLALSVSFLAALAIGSPARASQLVDRNATNVRLAVNSQGQALITYRASGRLRRVLGWGAVNARSSASGGKQVSFRLDYSGGWGTYHRRVWQTFRDSCRRYDGPVLEHVVASCTAADGTYWALQSWRVALPDLGFLPWLLTQKVAWLTLSHWGGQTAELDVHTDWIYSGRFQQVFGRLTYLGRPVYGYHTTPPAAGEVVRDGAPSLRWALRGLHCRARWRRDTDRRPAGPARREPRQWGRLSDRPRTRRARGRHRLR